MMRREVGKMKPRVGAAAIIRRFEKAVRAHEMLGSKYPDEWPEIRSDYRAAKGLIKKALCSRR
jgi:hypothetical protein